MTTPDYSRAAIKAAEILDKYEISSLPVSPIEIFEKAGYNLVSFKDLAHKAGMHRKDFMDIINQENHDAFSSVLMKDGKANYLVAYNKKLAKSIIQQRALAREMAHIVLGHDGSLPETVRNEEALCFSRHLLCPRPFIHALNEAGVKITVEVLGSTTGCFEHCLVGMRKTPATFVPADLNRRIKERFQEYIDELVDCQEYLAKEDDSMIANFGTYMDGYEE